MFENFKNEYSIRSTVVRAWAYRGWTGWSTKSCAKGVWPWIEYIATINTYELPFSSPKVYPLVHYTNSGPWFLSFLVGLSVCANFESGVGYITPPPRTPYYNKSESRVNPRIQNGVAPEREIDAKMDIIPNDHVVPSHYISNKALNWKVKTYTKLDIRPDYALSLSF